MLDRATSSDRQSPYQHGWELLALFAWVVLNYGWTVRFGLVTDDYLWIQGARTADGVSWLRAALVPPGFSGTFLRPLTQLSFFLNYLCVGTSAVGYHLVNVMLHLVNTCLIWRLALRLGLPPPASVLAAMIFAVQPTHAAAVTWVSGRTELLAATFYIGAVLSHLRWRTRSAAGFFALTLLAKETGVSFPLLAVACDVLWSAGGRWHRSATASYVAVLGSYLALRVCTMTHPFAETFGWGFAGRRLVERGDIAALASLGAHQLVQAARNLLGTLPLTGRAATGLLLAVIAGLLAASRDTPMYRIAWLAGMWMFITLLPFLGWFVFLPHYAYLPGVGFALLVVAGGTGLLGRTQPRPWRRTAAGVTAAFWIIGSAARLRYDNEGWRQNGIRTARILDRVSVAVPHPPRHAFFVLAGTEQFRIEYGPWIGFPVLLFGLPEALRLSFDDWTLDGSFSEDLKGGMAPAERPVIYLRWDSQAERFIR